MVATTLNHLILKNGISQSEHWIGNGIELFNVRNLLASRGFEDITEDSIESTLLSSTCSELFRSGQFGQTLQERISFIRAFNEKSFRQDVKKVIFHGLPSGNPLVDRYNFSSSTINELKFSKTLELAMAYLSVTDLKAFSASFGVNIKGTPDGGDYDCIANFYNDPVYFEVKSGLIQNTHENVLHSFIDRHLFLAPYASVLFFDYQGGKDKLDQIIAKVKTKEIGEAKIDHAYKVVQGGRQFYAILNNVVVVDIHSNGNILTNLRCAMQFLHRYRTLYQSSLIRQAGPGAMGYKVTEI
jgi:hypothetical protein